MNNELWLYVASYSLLLLIIFILFNFLSNNFLFWFIKIKSGRGKSILVINKGTIESYASRGWIEGKTFCYFDRETKKKEKNKICKRLTIKEGENPFFRLFNITCVTVDEATNNFILPSGKEVNGFDAIVQENLILWALQRPGEEDKIKMLLIICIIASIIAILISIAVFYRVNTLYPLIQSLGQISTVTGVNIP